LVCSSVIRLALSASLIAKTMDMTVAAINAHTATALEMETAGLRWHQRQACSAALTGLAVRHWRQNLAQAWKAATEAFAAGDLLFVDSSHLLMPGTDVDLLLTGAVEVTIDRSHGRCSLQALVAGEPLDTRGHPAALPVKGVTYHRLSVRETAEGWCATVVLDV